MTLLKVRDVADRLGLSRSTVLRYHAAGILPGFRLPGGALRFREDELDAWLEGQRTDGCQSLSGALESVK